MEKQLDEMPLVSYDKALEYIKTLEYGNEQNIVFLERQLYELLQTLNDDTNLLVLLMHEQIMHNRGARARSIANKIWEIGGAVTPTSEVIYIDNLMNLGLSEMAGAALAPYIADIGTSVQTQSFLLVKYALYSGNMVLLDRLLDYLPATEEYNILRDLIILFDELNVSTHLPAIMEKLFAKLQNSMLGFSFNLFSDREIPDVEFVFYVDDSVSDCEELRQSLDIVISSYCAAHQLEDLINLNTVVYPISRHLRFDKYFAGVL